MLKDFQFNRVQHNRVLLYSSTFKIKMFPHLHFSSHFSVKYNYCFKTNFHKYHLSFQYFESASLKHLTTSHDIDDTDFIEDDEIHDFHVTSIRSAHLYNACPKLGKL